MNGIKFPFPHRKAPVHRPRTLQGLGIDAEGWDDELEFNTQYSSQWDSLCHVTKDGTTYNGHKPTQAGLEVTSTAENTLPTIDHWHSRGVVVGRGVLIDFKRYYEETTGKSYNPLEGHRITTEEVEAAAKRQGVDFKQGDILIIRTGYTEVLEAPTPEMFAMFANATLSGMHGTTETARWVWNHRFAAVAGDAHAFEALPALKPDGTPGGITDLGESFSCIIFGSECVGADRWRVYSPAFVVPQPIWYAHRRALGPQGVERVRQEDGQVQLPADVGAVEPPWPGGIAAECGCSILGEAVRPKSAIEY